jgi:RNA polymerase sigma-70 factor, ECF subfamily
LSGFFITAAAKACLMGRMQVDQAEDHGAVRRVLTGEKEAFGELVQRHSRTVFRVAFRMTGREQDAEEVVQETFMRAYRNLEKFESRANFGTWVYRIAVNCSLDLLGKRPAGYTYQIADEPEIEAGEIQVAGDDPDPERMTFSGQMGDLIERAMRERTEIERTAFILRHMEGKSMEEIGEALGQKPNSAKQSVFRAVQKLRRALEPAMSTL